ncbi:hypothetical protein Daura_39905 [Dactylosporangium aurantiacum]|uniref:Uncharacterized protein n=1 Tax=Dactylosporangium aurantiacum TaxID=35754 RepID=A0A9Q9MKD3_9ACTN|nr:hypothetical protein [Dactylosporangium aurantiacum]MDG6101409.1 hypothetical protein [Dactylosporangium aurantiacum]UWZ52737.1 hypothetical protein Daura_39905 [Dactylosporangium aurantiacum]
MTRTLLQVSADLTQLAPGSSPGERAVRHLATLLKRADCSDLVGMDLAAVYPPPVVLPEHTGTLRHVVSVLELARDVLIFVPVIYTWWKLAQALQAYRRYDGTENFLLAWQQGFGERTDPLSGSAVVVATVVLAVILLTVAAHVARGRYEAAVQDRQQRLAALLAEARMLLARSLLAGAPDVSRVDLAAIGASITTSAQALQTALRRTSADITAAVNTSPGSKLREMFEQWTAAANELRTLGTRLQSTQEVVKELRSTQKALSGMAQNIGTETSRLLAALETERTLSRQEAHTHHKLAAEVGKSTELLGESLKGLNERAAQFNELILRLAFIVERIDTEDIEVSPTGGPHL